MKKRTIIENDAQFQYLFGHRNHLGRDKESSIDSKISDEDNGKAEFILNNDFGDKFDLAKDSSRFAYNILNRMLELNGAEELRYISIEGNQNSMAHFLSALMIQYLHHWGLRSINENDEFNT